MRPAKGESPIIQVSNLVKKYGDLTAVDGLSLDIYRGEVLGFLGPNGAGKTTTMNMICGLCQPTAGDIVFFGGQIKNRNDIKTHIGICPQENIFWPKLTCVEQLVFLGEMYGLSRQAAHNRSSELIDLMGLGGKSDTLASKLSGGMKKRLNVCLALIHNPEILLLDEAEAGLDPQSRVLVRDYIRTLATEKTIILTTHNMDEADRVADRVAIIDHGKLLLLDTPENLKRSIGEGDVLEIVLNTDHVTDPDKLLNTLLKTCERVNLSGPALLIKSRNLIESVSEITAIVRRQGFEIKQMTLRENTLEDVFIHLTGRELRQ